MIVSAESPKLDSAKFSGDFCNFVDKCLIKNADQRSNCVGLLEEKFITDYQDKSIDLDLLKQVIDEVKKDKIEAQRKEKDFISIYI